jgi:hypothetical protein
MMSEDVRRRASDEEPRPAKDRAGEDEGSAPVEGDDSGLKDDQKPVDR